ncbi:Pectin lyase-like superfamily protein [Quillaja saponaria]|uniref:Pectin lyase-like superfamily protein n=1 Tax=Quillaja saponaria TaxID=32244 RepID=A0AAD7VET1_QUISA|nr:Pectin lyase-like superfamily protein [Quillaja saponaria]
MATGRMLEGRAITVTFLGLALLSCMAVGASRGHFHVGGARRGLADTGPAVVDVTTFGAKADDKTDNVEAFMQGWIAACRNASGPSKLVIPQGTFVVGPMVFQGPCSQQPMIVEVHGTVKATTDVSEYTSAEWISFEGVDGLVLTGRGIFDGQGSSVWAYNDCKNNVKCAPLPASLKFTKVTNAIVEGITSLNSKQFHIHLIGCNNFTANNINITAPGDSPNTDGIHTSGSSLVNIINSVIGTGDDCVSIGQGSTQITITNVTCGPGHGISVGSLGKWPDEQSVVGVAVKNCTLTNTTNGARIKTWIGRKPGEAKNIVYEDIIMNNVKNPIIIDQSYGGGKNKPSKSVWKISDVHFRNIRGTSTTNVAISLACSTLNPCEGVEIKDIDLAFSGANRQNANILSSCSNAKATFAGRLSLPPPIRGGLRKILRRRAEKKQSAIIVVEGNKAITDKKALATQWKSVLDVVGQENEVLVLTLLYGNAPVPSSYAELCSVEQREGINHPHIKFLHHEITRSRKTYIDIFRPFYLRCRSYGVKFEAKIAAGFTPKDIIMEEMNNTKATWIIMDRYVSLIVDKYGLTKPMELKVELLGFLHITDHIKNSSLWPKKKSSLTKLVIVLDANFI